MKELKFILCAATRTTKTFKVVCKNIIAFGSVRECCACLSEWIEYKETYFYSKMQISTKLEKRKQNYSIQLDPYCRYLINDIIITIRV